MIAKIQSMEVMGDRVTARVIAEYQGQPVTAYMSLLELAKIFETDEEVVSQADNNFGSLKLERRLSEIQSVIGKYPDVTLASNQLVLEGVKSRECSDGSIKLTCEDMVGWDGEGIKVLFSRKAFSRNRLQDVSKIVISQGSIEVSFSS